MDAERFSLWRFYQRREVRIFPALFAMLAVVLAVGVLVLPNELARLSGSAAASAAFVSKTCFWQTVDYLGGLAETKPLLHTWSLGVEEQFYLVFPLLLLAVRRRLPRLVVPLLWVAAVGSFVLGWVLAHRDATGTFYLIRTRAWELAIGGAALGAGFARRGALRVGCDAARSRNAARGGVACLPGHAGADRAIPRGYLLRVGAECALRLRRVPEAEQNQAQRGATRQYEGEFPALLARAMKTGGAARWTGTGSARWTGSTGGSPR